MARAQGSYDPPPGYYAPAGGLTGPDLRGALNHIVDGHVRNSYDSVWTILENADAPQGPPTILTVYSNLLLPGLPHTAWTREHSWPKSYGFPDDSSCNYPYTDAHHLFPETPSFNSSRNNGPYDNCPDHLSAAVCASKLAAGFPAEVGNFRHVGSGEWEVWNDPGAVQGDLPVGRRGDVARAMFYMDIRYEGGPNPLNGCGGGIEPNLVLTSTLSAVVTTTESPAYMGNLDTLLKWTDEDPVDTFERRRNQVVFGYQQNRNPFVDHPEWVATVWPGNGQGGSPPTATPTATASGTIPVTPTITATSAGPTPTPGFVAYLPHTSRGYWIYAPTATATASVTPLPPTATRTLPPPTPTATVPSPTATNTLPPPTATLTPPPTSVPPAELVIGTLQCETTDESIRIDNIGGTAAQLSGWEIVSVVGPQTFAFPSYTLQPGASVSVHSGPDAPATGGSVFRWSGAYIWNNDSDQAELRNPAGDLVDDRDC